MPEHILVFLFTGSKYHNLIILLAHLFHHIINEVHALLIRQSGYDSYHKRIFLLWQAELLLQFCLILCLFLLEMPCTVILVNQSVCLRIPFIIIQPVHNPSQVMGSCSHQTIQILTIKRCLDLFCIRRTYCCKCICIYKTALQIIGISI